MFKSANVVMILLRSQPSAHCIFFFYKRRSNSFCIMIAPLFLYFVIIPSRIIKRWNGYHPKRKSLPYMVFHLISGLLEYCYGKYSLLVRISWKMCSRKQIYTLLTHYYTYNWGNCKSDIGWSLPHSSSKTASSLKRQ